MSCLFCEISNERIVAENDLAYAVHDGFPVTELHTHYFGLTQEELLACDNLIRSLKDEIMDSDSSVNGFNIGMNAGESAGQTVFHCHIHLIPRRSGDVENPRGGVRHLIPGKGNY